MLINKQQIVDQINQTEAVLTTWRQSEFDREGPENYRNPESGETSRIKELGADEATALAAIGIMTAKPNSEFGDDCIGIVLLIDEFTNHLGEWASRIAKNDRTVRPDGEMAMWAAWEAVLDAKKIWRKGNTESVKSLEKLGIPSEQIMNILELRDPDGTWRTDLLEQERDQPGSVIDENWVPYVRSEVRMNHEAWKEREKKEFADWNETMTVYEAANQPEAPFVSLEAKETIEELAEQGCTIEQIAHIKMEWIERELGTSHIVQYGSIEADRQQYVRDYLIANRIHHDDPAVQMAVEEKNRKLDMALKAAPEEIHQVLPKDIYTYADVGFTIDERIEAMAGDDIKPLMIVAALRINGDHVQKQHVLDVIDALSPQTAEQDEPAKPKAKRKATPKRTPAKA